MTAGRLLYRCRKCEMVEEIPVHDAIEAVAHAIYGNNWYPVAQAVPPKVYRRHTCVPRSDLGPAVYGVADLVGAIEDREEGTT